MSSRSINPILLAASLAPLCARGVNLSLNYTFANLKSQFLLGNDLAELLQFDRSTLIAIRHDVDGIGRQFQGGNDGLAAPLFSEKPADKWFIIAAAHTRRPTTAAYHRDDRVPPVDMPVVPVAPGATEHTPHTVGGLRRTRDTA